MQRQGNGELSASIVAGLRAASRHGRSDMKASLKRKMGPSSQTSPKRRNARSYLAWQQKLKNKSNVTDKRPSESSTFNAYNNVPADQIVNSGERTEGTKENYAARIRCSKECTSVDGGEKLGVSEGNRVRYCNGKGCKASCGISCFDPLMDDLSFGVWHCSSCVRKKMLYGVHSVSEGVESICKAQQKDILDKNGSMQVQWQYFVKYKVLAHVHNRWELESKLLVEAPSLIAKFSQRNQASNWQDAWMEPDRVLKRRPLISSFGHDKDPHFMSNCQHEWLVKWHGLGYEHATWELENSSFLCCPGGQVLIQDYYTRHKKEPSDKSLSKEVSQIPGGCSSDIELDNKCIGFVKKLQQYKNRNAIIFDKARIMKIISFVRSFSSDVYRPILIISTSDTLRSWEKEFLSLAKSVNVVVYSENRKIREHIRKVEFYRDNGSIMFQVLLTSPDIVTEDLEVLSCIGWEVIVVDECQSSKVAACLEQIKILQTGMRLLVASCQFKDSIPEYINVLSFLDSDGNSNSTKICSQDTKVIISKLKERLAGYVAYDSETKASRFVEYWVPAVISNVQLQMYCDTLLSNSLFLCSSSKSDYVGTLGNLLIALQKCCDHPYVVNQSIEQMLLTENQKEECLGIGIKASGKLILLDAMLSAMKKKGSNVLLLFQVTGDGFGRYSLGNILDDFLCHRFGPDSYGRIDAAAAPSRKKSALEKFNKEQGRFVLLLEKRACLSSIKLSSIDAIILYDSDWIPMNDVRTLQKLTFDMQVEQINLFRLYATCTMEEKVLILSTEGKILDGNVQNIGPGTGRELLMWDASYLFAKLDEYQQHSSLSALEKSHMEDVIQEFVTIPKSENNESSSIPMIVRVKLDGKVYHANHSLLGERKRQVKDGDSPHLFWTKKLAGRHPQSKFSADLTPKKRRRVQYFEESRKNLDYKNAEVDEELVKESSGNDNQDVFEGKHGISVREKDDDKSMVHEGKKLHDTEQSMCIGLKPELSELCEVLCLPEDVKAMVGKFLEYVIENYRISENSKDLADAYQNDNMNTKLKTWQALQISLCWTAASLVNHKIKHSESVMLAKKDLYYSCEKEDVYVAYSILMCVKEVFLHHLQRPIYPHSSQSTESYTKAVPCSSLESANFNIDAESSSVPKETPEWSGTSDSLSIPELQAAQRGLSKSIKWVEKKCDEKQRELFRKQKDENVDFEIKYEEEIASIKRMMKAEKAVVRLHINHLSINGKLKILENEYMEKSNELRLRMDQARKNLLAKQLEVRNKILNGKDHWIKLVTSWAQTEMIKHHSGGLSCAVGQVMLAGGECILDILENIITAQPLVISDGQNVASEVLGNTDLVAPPRSEKEVPSVSLSCSPIEENQLLIAGISPNGCDFEAFQRSEMQETFSQVYEVQENNATKKQSSASDVMDNMALVLLPSSEDEVPSVSLSCAPTEVNQLVRTGSSPKGRGVEACHWSEMRENNALEEQGAARDVTRNMAPALSSSCEKQMPSLSHSSSPTHEIQLERSRSNPDISEGGDANFRCGSEICQGNETMETDHQVFEVQEDIPHQQNSGELLENVTQAIPLASQNEVHCVSQPCGPTEEIQFGTGSTPVIREGNDANTGGVAEVCKHSLTNNTISQVSETREVALQEQNVLHIPNAVSALPPCNLRPQLTEQTSLVPNVPSIAEDRPSPFNQVPQNLSSLASATSVALAEDASNVNAQTTFQEVQASLCHAAASLIDVSCRNPEILASEPEEGMQDLESCRTHFQDLPSVDEYFPHGESQTTQRSQACRQLEGIQIELLNEDVLRPPRNATTPSCSSSHFMSSMNTTSSQTPLHVSNDPLQIEIERIQKEKEKISKMFEDTRLQLISDCKKEMEHIRTMYEAKLQENQSAFWSRDSELDSNYTLALRNKALAKSFRLKCNDSEAFRMEGNYHVTNSSTLQDQFPFSSQIVAPATLPPSARLESNLQPTPQTMDHQTQFIEHRSQFLSDALTTSPCSNSVHVPVWNIVAEREIQGPSTASLQDNFPHWPQILPGFPARPPLINNVCHGTASPQSEIHGLQPFRSLPLHLNPPVAMTPLFRTVGANRLQDPSFYAVSDAGPNLQNSSLHRGWEVPASVQQGPRKPSTLQSNPAQHSQSAIVVCISDDE